MSVLALLAACGNKGPLVLPQKPVDVPATPVEPSPKQDDAPAATGAAASGSTNTARPADPPKQDDGD